MLLVIHKLIENHELIIFNMKRGFIRLTIMLVMMKSGMSNDSNNDRSMFYWSNYCKLIQIYLKRMKENTLFSDFRAWDLTQMDSLAYLSAVFSMG